MRIYVYTFDLYGLSGDLIAETAKAMLRLRSSNSFIPHLFLAFFFADLVMKGVECDVLGQGFFIFIYRPMVKLFMKISSFHPIKYLDNNK